MESDISYDFDREEIISSTQLPSSLKKKRSAVSAGSSLKNGNSVPKKQKSTSPPESILIPDDETDGKPVDDDEKLWNDFNLVGKMEFFPPTRKFSSLKLNKLYKIVELKTLKNGSVSLYFI